MVRSPVLVLNQNYRPVNICQVRRAIVLVFRGKAEIVENGSGYIFSSYATFPLPSVIRLVYLVKGPPPHSKMTRLEVFNRDDYTCQYCGRQTKDLTLDHVIPKHQGGKHDWGNVVSACPACNRRKAGHTPSQANMRLLHQPAPIAPYSVRVPFTYLQDHTAWKNYVLQ
ncbi:MAG: HNH endonuclease [Dehalococcoidia bacterium]|nr:HNH endonuclease [Dehalococcoidia bacterium]MDZ4246987.1 HNH endonuclease [Dehalococcoidia bacterium]